MKENMQATIKKCFFFYLVLYAALYPEFACFCVCIESQVRRKVNVSSLVGGNTSNPCCFAVYLTVIQLVPC